MTIQDGIYGPLVFIVILIFGYFIRPLVTDQFSRMYFFPAIVAKMIGAVCLGLLFQIYYVGEGGDTFGYYYGGKRIWEYFIVNPVDAFRVIFWNGEFGGGIYTLVSRIPHYHDPASFFVVRIAGFLGLFTFGNYTGIALLFAVISFSGSWALYSSLNRMYPGLHKWLAIAILFIPSVVFWGSGILKDTLTFAALCWMIWAFINLVIQKRNKVLSIISFILGFLVIFSIKKYLLIVLIPALILWFYRVNIKKIRNGFLRHSLAPLILVAVFYSAYQAVVKVGEDDPKYSLDNITGTVSITAHDIRYWTGKEAGSGYELGAIPDTWQDMIMLFPAAVNVTLFRPYLWESSNALMLSLAFESSIFLLFVLILLVKRGLSLVNHFLNDPFLIFALVFSLGLGFAVGVSTWNFGTLVRYKLPLMPLFASMLVIIYWKDKIKTAKGTN